jgi:FkbM family methyltransferase
MRTLASIARWIASPLRPVIRPARRLLWKRNTELFRRHLTQESIRKTAPFFVKIGANDGVTGDPCSDLLISCQAWRGILIEPVPYCCDRLRENFSDSSRFRVVESAIDTQCGTRDMHFVSATARAVLPDLPIWYDQLGTFDPQHIEKHFGQRIKPFIEKKTVSVRTYADIMMEMEVSNYALLHVDTEGYDFEILKMALSYPLLPSIIFIEHAHLSSGDRAAMLAALRKHGYDVRNCGMDFFATRRTPT